MRKLKRSVRAANSKYYRAFQNPRKKGRHLGPRTGPAAWSREIAFQSFEVSRYSKAGGPALNCLPLTVKTRSTARHRCRFYKPGKRFENSPYLARMLQSITRVSPVGLISHYLSKPQRAQDIARARHAPADSLRDLTGGQVFTIGQQANHGKGDRVPEQTT
jgi:hypothetical protein